MSNDFRILVYTPAIWEKPGVALAATQSRGVGIIDFEYVSDKDIDLATASFHQLVAETATPQEIGLRISADRLNVIAGLLESVAPRQIFLILTKASIETITTARKLLACCPGSQLWIEICDASGELCKAAVGKVDGVIAAGNEAAGWVSPDTSFVLAQKLQARGDIPFIMRGGIGPFTAAACRAAGAAGVVLDDQVLLMPESPLPWRLRAMLERVGGDDTYCMGEALATPDPAQPDAGGCRVLTQRGSAINKRTLEAKEVDSELLSFLQDRIDWSGDSDCLLPVGQGISQANEFVKRYGTTSRCVASVYRESQHWLDVAHEQSAFNEGSALAQAHGTKFPVVQGAMAHVSDVPAFSQAVAEAGALPMLSLAGLDDDTLKQRLHETAERLGELPWGAGILGFSGERTSEETAQLVAPASPACVLIAGGSPSLAAPFTKRGIPAYLHVPVPSLLRSYINQDVRHFVFEGRECGGHVGPLGGFVLWEIMISTLLSEMPKGKENTFHVLFAGGIHDTISSAMIAAMAAPLVARGVRVGILMGTAYLSTNEAVACNAISSGFQEHLIACRRTAVLAMSPGHANRVAETEFTSTFRKERAGLMAQDLSAEEQTLSLIELCRGRLRHATKEGLDGLCMMGQIATLREKTLSLEELHETVTSGAMKRLSKMATPHSDKSDPAAGPSASAIAIVGMNVILPGSTTIEDFWKNTLDGSTFIKEIPERLWDWRLYFNADRKSEDHIYSKWGAFIDPIMFDPTHYGIPPQSLHNISPAQLLALQSSEKALEDMGPGAEVDRQRTGVVFAASDAGGFLGQHYTTRVMTPLFVPGTQDSYRKRMPHWSEESFPGTLSSVLAGRVANRLNLGGPNLTIDSACSSSLYAVDAAVKELESGRSDVMIAGGIEVGTTPLQYMSFSRTQALSPTGQSRAFDRKANGMVMGEGVVVLVLKRLADAEAAGDRIYAVIRGIGASSDGRTQGITAPNVYGQKLALNRAYKQAGFPMSAIRYYEAHGTGTPVGDKTETQTLLETLQEQNASPNTCLVGSAKNQVGHLKVGAGMVGLAKAATSLYYQSLPPHAGIDNPLEPYDDPNTPVGLLRRAQPWFAPHSQRRRAGISSFGFGGTNCHVALEEYPPASQLHTLGAEIWPAELLILTANDTSGLASEISTLLSAIKAGAKPRLVDLACTLAVKAENRQSHGTRLAVVCSDLTELNHILQKVQSHLKDSTLPWPPEAHLSAEPHDTEQKLAFLFPGQGSQYPDMARELALYFPELRDSLAAADAVVEDQFPVPLSRLIYPESAFSPAREKEHRRQLSDSQVTQPATGAVSAGMVRILKRLGLKPDMLAGHSYGEITALHAAGALSQDTFLRLSAERGRLMSKAGETCPGGMVMLRAGAKDVDKWAQNVDGVVVANYNAPEQTIVSGTKAALETLLSQIPDTIETRTLAVSGAFHSPLMEPVQHELSAWLTNAPVSPLLASVYSNVTATAYDESADSVRETLQRQLLSPVRFVDEVEKMYADGARTFVEVGPGRVLSGLVGKILTDREHTVVTLDHQDEGLRQFLGAVAHLYTAGYTIIPSALFDGRQPQVLDLANLVETTRPADPTPTTWLVDTCHATPAKAPKPFWGEQPLLNSNTSQSTPAPTQAGEHPALQAYLSHQETMRQFLALQERILQNACGGGAQSTTFSNLPALPELQVAAAEPISLPAAQETTAATPENAPTIDSAEALLTLLQRVLEERTGYPVDMLGPDLDMEAELGIDSIKRTELLEHLRTVLPPELTADFKDQAATLSKARTLQGLADMIMAQRREISEPVEQTRDVGAPAIESAEELLILLQRVLEERTGYPVEMLDPDLDMEAELGIDSIKRTELLEHLRTVLPSELTADFKDQAATLSKARTLQGLADMIMDLKDTASNTDNVPAERTPVTAEATQEAGCPRFVMQADASPLSTSGTGAVSGLYLITPDRTGIADAIAKKLTVLGATPIILDAQTDSQTAIQEAQRAHGPVQGLLHLKPLDAGKMPDTLTEWRDSANEGIKNFYDLLKTVESDIVAAKGQVLVATRMGGACGRDSTLGSASPMEGAYLGLLNCLRLEWPDVSCRAVDFPKNLQPKDIGDLLLKEINAVDQAVEVGYRDGQRMQFKACAENVDISSVPTDNKLPSGAVILATGGASGITARILDDLVQPGMHLILVGRTPVNDDDPTWAQQHAEPAQLRKAFLDDASAIGSKVAPKDVEKAINGVIRSRAIRSTIEDFRRKGVETDYYSIDVRDEAEFGGFIISLYDRFGRIDAVLHGAGVIKDKLLVDKDSESLNIVFDTKVDSAFILSKYLRPEFLSLMVFFTSVAGRFGTRGQTDYAAANEVMNRLAWALSTQWPNTQVVAVNWGPWAEVGMAVDLGEEFFLKQGSVPIPPSAGVKFLLDEIGSESKAVEVVAGYGFWADKKESLISA